MTDIAKTDSLAKILIVDDQEANLLALERVLSDLPAELIRANSGEEALTLITEHEFALVLLDVQMPVMDGFETAELMRQNRYTETIPIIFVTAISKEKVHVFKGYQAGAVDYLFKPIDPHLLQSKVQIFLDIFYQKTQRLVGLLRELQSTRLQLESNNRELEKLASVDVLTELPNRRQFEEELNRCLAYAKRYHTKFAVIFMDLDNFKTINDTYGHTIGDGVLRLSGAKVLSQLRREDFLARLGGDEFGIILTRLNSHEDAGKIAESIKAVFQGLHVIDGNELTIGMSMGIACYPFAGKTEDELLKNADVAMYRAKELGKNNYEFFSKEVSEEYLKRINVEKALHQALSDNEFRLVYQVVYDLQTGKPAGVESLIRWNHPELGDISPAEFIPMSEEMGLIQQIGRWVIENACKQFDAWCQQGFDDLNFAINLSPKQLQQADLITNTQEVLSHLSIDPSCITLELTETAIMEHVSESERMLQRLHDLGIQISIDDFGTGYSSLVRLRNLPIHALKVDQTFVRDVIDDKNDAIIVKAILSLANSLGLKTIAEGIENKEQLEFLKHEQCQFGQGFYLQKPLSVDEVTRIFEEAKKNG